jgi:hypothetical protein
MQADLLERFADTQSALIAALDSGDTAAMIAHTRDLGGITDALRTQGVLRADTSTRSQLDSLLKFNTAAAQRLRFLRDDVERRVGSLQGEDAATYRAPSLRR